MLARRGKFISNEFNESCIEKGIKRQLSTPGILQKNIIVERRNIFIMDCARTLMIENNVARKYLKEAISIVVHNLNRVQLKKDSNQTPYELWLATNPM